ncbi:hypothetical protein GALL_239480 [mine drainage metagenome]|uniref:Cytochrome C oxidase subunit I n=1 Tax=mine drainage metagenome TaxID=410659 RepID=A0A1J5RDF6_9ZZZZ
MTQDVARAVQPGTEVPPRKRSMWSFWMVVLVSAAPVVASFFVYYVIQPQGKPAYGELVQPQRPVPQLQLTTLAGKPVDLRKYNGYWLMIMAGPASCDARCQNLLFDIRQFFIAAGDDRYRVARVWLVTDQGPVNPGVLGPAAGTVILRARPEQLKKWLPLAAGEHLEGPIWLVDPLGNLMMRFPSNPDPLKTLSVFKKLLYNTAAWKPKHLEPLP